MGSYSIGNLNKLYRNDDTYTAILNRIKRFASEEGHWDETTVEQIQESEVNEAGEISRTDVVQFFKEIEKQGYGNFVTGRRGKPSRFKWTAQMEATEYSIRSKKVDKEAPITISHSYALRPDFTVKFDLPQDLNQNEAERLGDNIRTLPFQEYSSQK